MDFGLLDLLAVVSGLRMYLIRLLRYLVLCTAKCLVTTIKLLQLLAFDIKVLLNFLDEVTNALHQELTVVWC